MKLSSITQSNVMRVNMLKNDSSKESNSSNVNFKGVSANNILNAMDSYAKANKAQISFCKAPESNYNQASDISYSPYELRQMSKEERLALFGKLAKNDPDMLAESIRYMNPEEKSEVLTGCLMVISDEKKSDVLGDFLDRLSTKPKCITEKIVEELVEMLNTVEDEYIRLSILKRNDNQAAKIIARYGNNKTGNENVNRVINDFPSENGRQLAANIIFKEYLNCLHSSNGSEGNE